MSWSMGEAKRNFDELLRRAQVEGPQTVTRHGKDIAVVLGPAEFRRLYAHNPSIAEPLLSAAITDDTESDQPREPNRESDL